MEEALLLNLHPVMHSFSTVATVFDTLRRQQTYLRSMQTFEHPLHPIQLSGTNPTLLKIVESLGSSGTMIVLDKPN
jgi:hypothetical protein